MHGCSELAWDIILSILCKVTWIDKNSRIPSYYVLASHLIESNHAYHFDYCAILKYGPEWMILNCCTVAGNVRVIWSRDRWHISLFIQYSPLWLRERCLIKSYDFFRRSIPNVVDATTHIDDTTRVGGKMRKSPPSRNDLWKGDPSEDLSTDIEYEQQKERHDYEAQSTA